MKQFERTNNFLRRASCGIYFNRTNDLWLLFRTEECETPFDGASSIYTHRRILLCSFGTAWPCRMVKSVQPTNCVVVWTTMTSQNINRPSNTNIFTAVYSAFHTFSFWLSLQKRDIHTIYKRTGRHNLLWNVRITQGQCMCNILLYVNVIHRLCVVAYIFWKFSAI